MATSEPSTCLAIVGASVRAAAQSALLAGFDVVGADLFADADLDGACPITKIDNYPDGLADWLSSQDVDAWVYTGALENYPDLVDRMALVAPLWGVSGAALRRCRDPLWLQEVFAKRGVAFPETLPAGVEPSDAGVWLAKTYRHAAGAGVWRYGKQPTGNPVYAQRWVEGEPMAAVYAVAAEGARLLGLTRQIVEGYAYRGSIGPTQPSAKVDDQLSLIGEALSCDLTLRGLVGVDLVVSDQSITAIEVNPRYTASVEVLEWASHASAIAAHAACFASPSPPKWPAPDAAVIGKRIVFASRPIEVDRRLSDELMTLQRPGQLADTPRAGTVIYAGEPFCTVLAEGASLQEAERLLDAVAERLIARCL